MCIDTNDLIIKINNQLIDNSKMYSIKFPILLSKLKTNEELEFSMKSMCNNGCNNAIYNASHCYWDKISDNEYNIKIESNGQLTEYNILLDVCDIIIDKLETLKKNFSNEQYKIITFGKNKAIIELYNENYISFGPINYMLQNLDDIKTSGISRSSYMEQKIQLTIETINNNPLDNIFTAIDNCVELYGDIKNKIKKISKSK